jgi:ssDNA-binding Zn-finger/Zn-ribbon topoisomerase 1
MAAPPSRVDASSVERLAVECLCCGQRRIVAQRQPYTFMRIDECPRCGYLGWAHSAVLTERARDMLRRRPPEQRHLYAV